jgi:hypothetical protein
LQSTDPEIIFKPQWKEKEIRNFLSETFKKIIVEPSQKYEIKETIVTKEIPVYVEKIIENRVEVPVQI